MHGSAISTRSSQLPSGTRKQPQKKWPHVQYKTDDQPHPWRKFNPISQPQMARAVRVVCPRQQRHSARPPIPAWGLWVPFASRVVSGTRVAQTLILESCSTRVRTFPVPSIVGSWKLLITRLFAEFVLQFPLRERFTKCAFTAARGGSDRWSCSCPSCGTGKRASFRSLWPQGCAASSPLLGTMIPNGYPTLRKRRRTFRLLGCGQMIYLNFLFPTRTI
jgi:hypothetical protein